MRTITILANIAWIGLTVIFIIVFLAMGVFLVVFPFKEFSIDSLLSRHRILAMIIGILMVAMVIKYFVAMWLRTRRENCIAFDNPDGEVIIAVHAVEDSIKSLVESFNEVRSVSPNVVAVNDGVDVEVRVTLWDDTNVHAVSERVQSATKSHIQSFFGLANVNTVKIFISGTASRGAETQTNLEFDESGTQNKKSEGGSPGN